MSPNRPKPKAGNLSQGRQHIANSLYKRVFRIMESYRDGSLTKSLIFEIQQTERGDLNSEVELVKIKNAIFVACCVLRQAVVELREISKKSNSAPFILALLNNSVSEINFVSVRLSSIIYCIVEYCKGNNVDPGEYEIFNDFVIPVLMRVNSSCNINGFESISKAKIRIIKNSLEVVEPRLDGEMVKVSASYKFKWPSVEYAGPSDYSPWRTNTQVSEKNWFRLSDWGYYVSGAVLDPHRPKILQNIVLSGSDKFGTHHSIIMLKMVAYTIASFVRMAKGRRDDMSESIRIWEHDLKKLREKYYDRLQFVL